MTLEELDDIARMVGVFPPYKPGAAGWLTLDCLATMIGVSDTGFAKMRKRVGNRFEHRDKRGHVFIYSPLWLRAWKIVRQQQRINQWPI